jgi:uncharacterized protein YqgC (DUF456 family)
MTFSDMDQHLTIALLIMLVGLFGAIAPIIPGPPIVWLGALYYAWQTDFQEVGFLTLTVLGVLAIVGGTSDWWLSYLGARRGGASGWATLASFVGGIVGFLVFNVVGMVVGSLAGVILVEYMRLRDWRHVWRASRGYLAGWLLAAVVEVVACILMIALFFLASAL